MSKKDPKTKANPSRAVSSVSTEKHNSPISAKLVQLDELTNWFYSDEFSLDQALTKYQTATTLATEIQNDLNELRNQVEVLRKDFTKK